MAMRKRDRILVLEKEHNADIGLFDPEVFKGKNNLHLVRDDHCYWSFKYEKGTVPPALRERWTDFNTAKRTAEQYFKTKHIRIKEVID